MDSAFTVWFKSIFIKRRWTVLTLGGLIATPIQWLINHLSALPADLKTASVWQAPWWMYALCFILSLWIAQILAWCEQHRIVRELTGRPDVTLEINDGGELFVLKNSSRTAVDITIDDMPIQFPGQQIQHIEKLASGPITLQIGWIIKFDSVQAIHAMGTAIMNYRIPGLVSASGFTPPENVKSKVRMILDQFGDNADLEYPITLMFSNLGPPKRTWHSHYNLIYRAKRLSVEHIDIGEVKIGQMECSCCATNSGAR